MVVDKLIVNEVSAQNYPYSVTNPAVNTNFITPTVDLWGFNGVVFNWRLFYSTSVTTNAGSFAYGFIEMSDSLAFTNIVQTIGYSSNQATLQSPRVLRYARLNLTTNPTSTLNGVTNTLLYVTCYKSLEMLELCAKGHDQHYFRQASIDFNNVSARIIIPSNPPLTRIIAFAQNAAVIVTPAATNTWFDAAFVGIFAAPPFGFTAPLNGFIRTDFPSMNVGYIDLATDTVVGARNLYVVSCNVPNA